MNHFNRRRFLKSSLLAGAALQLSCAPERGRHSASPAPGSAQLNPRGANEDIRYAVVGFHGRGQDHLKGMRKVKGARLVALCDVDRDVLDKQVKIARGLNERVEAYTDIRKLLENKDLDAVTFATPNHWHCLGAIWAVQAGKDVYVEKPVSHNVWEGRQLVNAARQYNRAVQVGTQIRSNPGVVEAIAWLREGHLGKILCARGLCYKKRDSIGQAGGPQPIPPSIDYDLWCGPAPKGPLLRKRLHYDWHWVWPTGNGDLGNQGIHQMDLARWALGEADLAPRVLSLGGRLGYQDDGTTPNTQIIFHDYPTAPLIFEVRGLPERAGAKEMDNYYGASIGLVVDCEGGRMVIADYESARVFDKDGKRIKEFKGAASHFENFISVVRSRKYSDLRGNVLEGHVSSALCHTGNISYRLGRTLPPEEIRDAVKDNKQLAESLGRMETHLAANNVDLHQSPATLGLLLNVDPKAERFVGNAPANEMLTREYRAPFVVPEIAGS
jgi:predicted dehydrogenase